MQKLKIFLKWLIKIEIKETGEKAVVMDTMAIKVEINGDIAVTTYDMTFYNPNNSR